MNILIFGGTTEGRLLARELTDLGHAVTVSVATDLGAEALGPISCRVLTGRLDRAAMEPLVKAYELVIDATHPYAREASRNIRGACGAGSVPLRRVLRGESLAEGCIPVEDCAGAAAWLRERPGNVLIATGSKDLGKFAGLDPARLYPRVLPTHEALRACEALGIPHSHILALQGPFSLEMNLAMLRQYEIRYLVTKDGGGPGGFGEKLAAAKQAGTEVILVGRPREEGVSLEKLRKELEGTA